MDQLLTKDISRVSDVRGEVMELYTHMDQEIRKFTVEYENLCKREMQDLSSRQANGESALTQLDAKHKGLRQNLRQIRDAQIHRCLNEIQQAEQEKAAEDRRGEDDYNRWEKKHQGYVDQKLAEYHQKDQEDDHFLQSFETVRNRVRKTLPKNLYDNITENVTAVSCGSEKAAKDILIRYSAKNRTETENEIFKIQNSLLRRLFFYGKRNQLCCALEQMTKDVRGAVKKLHKCRMDHENELYKEFDDLKTEHRKKLASVKKKNQSVFDQKKKTCDQKIALANHDYGNKDAQQKGINDTEYQQKKTQLNTEYANAQRIWNQEKMKSQRNFAAKMEAEFPQARCNALVQNLWKMSMEFWPNAFGKKPMAKREALRNVAVGEQMINVGRWYQTPNAGEVLKRLMSGRYAFLFYSSVKNGKRESNPEYLYLPFFFSLEKGENLIACTKDALQGEMENFLQAVGIRLLWGIPAGQSQFLLGDAYKIGSFSELVSLDPANFNAGGTSAYKSILRGNQAWNSINDILQQINDQKGYYNSSGQVTGAASLREYNIKNPMNRHNFQITMIQKFPEGLKEDALQALGMLGRDCGRSGYSSILSGSSSNFHNVDPKLQNALSQVMSSGICLFMNDNKMFTIRTSSKAFERGSLLRLYPEPNAGVLDSMRNQLKTETENAGHNVIYFEQAREICPEPANWFKECADNGIVVPIGYLDGGETCKMVFDDSRVHSIVNGDTGSGKTNLLHVLITNILLRYPPEEVELYLIDFKRGKEFRKYTDFNLPGLKAVSVGNEPEYALQILKEIDTQIANRNTQFGSVITSLASYNRSHQKKLPRIVVILDELYEMILEAKALKSAKSTNIRNEIMKLLKGFAIQSRAYGVHMVIAGQHLTDIPEIKLIKESCNTRIALTCSEQEAEALINKTAKDRMRLINQQDKGACIVQLEKNGNPQLEHTAFLDPDHQHIQLLKAIHEHYCKKKQYGNPRVLTVEVGANPNNIFMRYMERGDLSMLVPGQICIGECISMRRMSGIWVKDKNLWIAGGSTQEAEEASRSLMFFVLLSLLLEQKKSGNQVIFYNSETDQNNPVGMDDRAGELSLALPQMVRYATGEKLSGALQLVYQELAARKSGNSKNKNKIWFVLRKPEDVMVQNPKMMQIFQEILLEGPSVGIQTILYTLDPQKLAQLNLVGMPFADKILLEMDNSFYQQVLGSKPNTEPGNFVATTSNNMRVRVFDLPDRLWVENMVKRLKK